MSTDIHALSGAYAVDALDDLERARFERHLAECEACTAEVASLREASVLLAETTPAAPPASLRDSVLAGIETVRPLPPVVTPTVPAERRGRRRLAGLVAAAAVLAAVGAGAVWQPWEDSTSQGPRQLTAAAVLEAPDAETYTERLEGGAEVRVVRSTSLNGAVVVTRGMQPPAPGKTYELWLQHGDRMVPAGLMPEPGEPVLMTGDAATAIGAGVTIEDAAGADEPTLPAVATFDFETT